MYVVRTKETEDPRRRWLVRALAAGFFSAGFFPQRILAQTFLGGRPAKLPAGQSIYRLSGDVKINDKAATLQTPIGPADTIETAKDAEIVYVVGENAFMLRGESRITLQGQASGSILLHGFRIVTGALLSVFPKGRPLRLSTETATIGIRGTGVYVHAESKQTYFCTCYGTTDVAATNDAQSRETVNATHHNRPLYILADEKPGLNIREAPFIDHTDQELTLIEALVGRTPPFIFPKDDYTGPRREY